MLPDKRDPVKDTEKKTQLSGRASLQGEGSQGSARSSLLSNHDGERGVKAFTFFLAHLDLIPDLPELSLE